MASPLPPIDGRLRTHCSECKHAFYVGKSLAMEAGHNSGHALCQKCGSFLHVEILEGDAAWTEPFNTYMARKA